MDFIHHNYPGNTLQHHVTDVMFSISKTWVLKTQFATEAERQGNSEEAISNVNIHNIYMNSNEY